MGSMGDALASRGHHAKEKAMDMLLRAKEFTVKSASGAKDLALNAKDIHKDLFVFQKTLRDMIKGMRNMRDQEERYLAEALQAIRKEIRSPEPKTKAVALEKLTYLTMSGYDMCWASFHCVEVMSQPKLALKHAGYLAVQQSFLDNTDVLLLIPNLLKKDLASSNAIEAGFALDSLANIMTPDLARDLVSDIFNLLSSPRGYLRKKAVLVLYKAFLRYPEALRPAFPRLTEKIEDTDPSVVSAVVTVLCELCIHNPQNYLPMAPTFYRLLQTSTNNWMTIKLVRIFGQLAPLEPRLGKKLVDPLRQIMTTTPAKSLLYECIRTVTHGLSEHTVLVRLAVEKLREFIDEPDPNLKYLGLQALQELRVSHPRAVTEHKETIFACLQEGDYTIQTCALTLVRGMVNRRNLHDTVLHLMLTMRRAEQPFRDDIVLTVLEMCGDDRYAMLTDFEWYISVLVELARVPETSHGNVIGQQLLDLTARVEAVREGAVRVLRPLILDPSLLEVKPANKSVGHALLAAVYITGEHAQFVQNRAEMVEALLQPSIANLPAHVQQVYVQGLLKVFSRLGACMVAPAAAPVVPAAETPKQTSDDTPEEALEVKAEPMEEEVTAEQAEEEQAADAEAGEAQAETPVVAEAVAPEAEVEAPEAEAADAEAAEAEAADAEAAEAEAADAEAAEAEAADAEAAEAEAEPEAPAAELEPAPPAAAAVDPALWRAELAEVRALRAVILAHIGPFMRSASMEVAERACHLAALLNLLALAESMEADQAAKDATLAACMAQLDQLFAEELVPVSVKAQKRVPVPLELDLMAPIPESVLQFMAEGPADDYEYSSDEDTEDESRSGRKSKKSKKSKHRKREKDTFDIDEVDDDINAAEALLSKSKKERVKASAAARDLHDKHKARHSTFYLGGGGGGERASADKDGGAVPLDVQSLDLDEKVPQWSAKQKSSKSNAVKYVVRGNEDGDDDSDDGDAGGGGGYTELKSSGKAGSKSKKKSAAPAYKPDAFKQLDMDVLAPLKDGEDLPEVEAYPTFDPTNGYFVEERSKDSKRRKHKAHGKEKKAKTDKPTADGVKESSSKSKKKSSKSEPKVPKEPKEPKDMKEVKEATSAEAETAEAFTLAKEPSKKSSSKDKSASSAKEKKEKAHKPADDAPKKSKKKKSSSKDKSDVAADLAKLALDS